MDRRCRILGRVLGAARNLCAAGLWSLICTSASAQAAEGEITLNSLDAWANVFAGQTAKFHFAAVPKVPAGSKAIWILSSSDQRGLASGLKAFETNAAGETIVEVSVPMPSVKNGVVLPVRLQVGLQLESNSTALATCEKQVLIFPTDPFADRAQWLKEMKIGLLDPSGATAARFEKAEIPFRPVQDAPRIDDEFEGLLMIGEKISLRDYPDLIEDAAKWAASGKFVLCLAPADGQLAIPGVVESPGQNAVSLSFAGPEVIRQLDKRLDAVGWLATERIADRRLRLVVDGDRVLGQVDAKTGGWAWMEAAFPETGGRLIVCQFDLIAKWELSPNPRYLFARILETLTAPNTTPTQERNERP